MKCCMNYIKILMSHFLGRWPHKLKDQVHPHAVSNEDVIFQIQFYNFIFYTVSIQQQFIACRSGGSPTAKIGSAFLYFPTTVFRL